MADSEYRVRLGLVQLDGMYVVFQVYVNFFFLQYYVVIL